MSPKLCEFLCILMGVLVLATPLLLSAGENDWPTHRHDYHRSCSTSVQTTLPLRLQWLYKARNKPMPAWNETVSPTAFNMYYTGPLNAYGAAYDVVAAGGRVFFGSSTDDKITCLDLTTGNEVWTYFTGGPVRLSPAISDTLLLAGSDDGCVYALHVTNGRLVWKFNPHPTAPWIAGNQRIISSLPVRTDILIENAKQGRFGAGLFSSAGRFLHTIDLSNGAPISEQSMTKTCEGYFSVNGTDTIFIQQGRADKISLGVTVQPLAKYSVNDGATIYVGGRKFIGTDGLVTGGSNEWTASVQGKAHCLTFADGRLLVSTSEGYIYCFGQDAVTPDTVVPSNTVFPYSSTTVEQQYKNAAALILTTAGTDRGYALVMDNEDGGLAYQLALQSNLQVICVETDSTKAEKARRRLDSAGVYGRVAVHLVSSSAALPYTDLLFNIVTYDGYAAGAAFRGFRSEAERVLHPYGGVAFLGPDPGDVVRKTSVYGIGEWTHNYADPANTANSNDAYVGKNVRLQWFGEPGPLHAEETHNRTNSPLWKNGILMIPGENWVTAVDAYNGTRLWEKAIPSSSRMPGHLYTGTLVLQDDALYAASGATCLALSPQTGKQITSFQLPFDNTSGRYYWGYLAVVGDILFGSAMYAEVVTKPNKAGRSASGYFGFDDKLFAYDRHSGALKWTYVPDSGVIVSTTLCIRNNKLMFLESTNPATFEQYNQTPPTGTNRGQISPSALFGNKMTRIVALDIETGSPVWKQSGDFSAITGYLNMVASPSRLVVTGSYPDAANIDLAHYVIFGFDINTGTQVFKDTVYQLGGGGHGIYQARPVMIGNMLYYKGNTSFMKCDMNSGDAMKLWDTRTGFYKCGVLSASQSSFFYRSTGGAMGGPSAFDFKDVAVTGTNCQLLDYGTRTGCWINIIPAGGLLSIPEYSAGCWCAYPTQTSLVFRSNSTLQTSLEKLDITSSLHAEALSLAHAAPNPFLASTIIRFSIPAKFKTLPYTLKIYDVSGRLIRTLSSGSADLGIKEAIWNGRGNNGLLVGTGIYYCRLICGNKSVSQRIVLAK